MRRRSIKAKLVSMMMGTSTLALVVAGGAFLYFDSEYFEKRTTDDLSHVAELLEPFTEKALVFASSEGDPHEGDELLRSFAAKKRIVRADITKADGLAFASYWRDD